MFIKMTKTKIPVNEARELIIKQEQTSFKQDVLRMNFGGDKKIIFDTFGNYAKRTRTPPAEFEQIKDGCTVKRGNVYIILTHSRPDALSNPRYSAHKLHKSGGNTGFGNSNKVRRINWTLAHEVGHVMLGHLKDDVKEEVEANAFASELLMPELIILELRRRLGRTVCPYEISRLFGVSQRAAECRMAQIERKSKFSPYLKRELMDKYQTNINDYVEKNKEKLCQTITM